MKAMTGVNNKILIMAGGTGGHVFPALSIARCLRDKGIEVEWLGTRNGLEAKVIAATDIPLHYISIAGLRGSSLLRKLLSPLVIFMAVLQSISALIRIKPGCVLGMGGFVTGPGGLAARLLGKTLLIHEQNAIAGLTNQLLFPLASTVMEAFPGAFARKQALSGSAFMKRLIKPEQTVVVGNPVRSDIVECGKLRVNRQESHEQLRVLIIGGSLGAVAINKTIPAMLALMADSQRPAILHQCGTRNLEETESFYREAGITLDAQVRVQAFIDDMSEAYAWADIIIARAGAMTVAEIAVAGLASVLIPYPYAVDDHQSANAAYLADRQAARVIPQHELTAASLLAAVQEIAADRQVLQQISRNALAAGNPDATAKAAQFCLEACHA